LAFKHVKIPLHPELTSTYIVVEHYDDPEKAKEHAKLLKMDGWNVVVVKGLIV